MSVADLKAGVVVSIASNHARADGAFVGHVAGTTDPARVLVYPWEPEAKPVAPGDVVRLKSGGPRMTVSTVESDDRGQFVKCFWFSQSVDGFGAVDGHAFSMECLERVTE